MATLVDSGDVSLLTLYHPTPACWIYPCGVGTKLKHFSFFFICLLLGKWVESGGGGGVRRMALYPLLHGKMNKYFATFAQTLVSEQRQDAAVHYQPHRERR